MATYGSASTSCGSRGYAIYVYKFDKFEPATVNNIHCGSGYVAPSPPIELPGSVQNSVKDGDLWISCCIAGSGGGGSSSG